MIRVFCGWDAREAVGFHAFAQSLIETTSTSFSLTPLWHGNQRDGTNLFTYARFLVPYHCHFRGRAIFVDGADMLVRGDIAELPELLDIGEAVAVVKHEYKTAHPRKYVGTPMEAANEDYPRKNWSSVIVWDCGNFKNRVLTPEFIAEKDGSFLHRFSWLPDERIGSLPIEWNWLCDEYGENENAKLLHWTAGIPGFSHYRLSPHAQEWLKAKNRVCMGMQ